MTHDGPEHGVRELWQSRGEEEVRMAIGEIRQRARTMEKTIHRRNLREYVGGLLVFVFFGLTIWRETNVGVGVGAGLIVLAAIYVMYRLRAWGSARSMPADLALKDCLEFHRTELVRQRDLLRSVWSWYLLPFVPGAALIIIARALERPDRRVFALGVTAAFALTLVLIGKLNAYVAHEIERKIDDLDLGSRVSAPGQDAGGDRQ